MGHGRSCSLDEAVYGAKQGNIRTAVQPQWNYTIGTLEMACFGLRRDKPVPHREIMLTSHKKVGLLLLVPHK